MWHRSHTQVTAVPLHPQPAGWTRLERFLFQTHIYGVKPRSRLVRNSPDTCVRLTSCGQWCPSAAAALPFRGTRVRGSGSVSVPVPWVTPRTPLAGPPRSAVTRLPAPPPRLRPAPSPATGLLSPGCCHLPHCVCRRDLHASSCRCWGTLSMTSFSANGLVSKNKSVKR